MLVPRDCWCVERLGWVEDVAHRGEELVGTVAAFNRPLDVVSVQDGVGGHEEPPLREVVAGRAGDEALDLRGEVPVDGP